MSGKGEFMSSYIPYTEAEKEKAKKFIDVK